jgi:hypothetical protein
MEFSKCSPAKAQTYDDSVLGGGASMDDIVNLSYLMSTLLRNFEAANRHSPGVIRIRVLLSGELPKNFGRA